MDLKLMYVVCNRKLTNQLQQKENLNQLGGLYSICLNRMFGKYRKMDGEFSRHKYWQKTSGQNVACSEESVGKKVKRLFIRLFLPAFLYNSWLCQEKQKLNVTGTLYMVHLGMNGC